MKKLEEKPKPKVPVTLVVTMPPELLEKLGVSEMTRWMAESLGKNAVINTSWGTIRRLPEGIRL